MWFEGVELKNDIGVWNIDCNILEKYFWLVLSLIIDIVIVWKNIYVVLENVSNEYIVINVFVEIFVELFFVGEVFYVI